MLATKELSIEETLSQIGYVVYTCKGNSMLPLIRQRQDVVEIRPLSKPPRKYDVILYKCNKTYILHRILKVRQKDYVLCGDHNIWREYGITDNEILGVMTRIIRNGKSIYPTDFKYRLYVHLWCDFFHIRAAILYARHLTAAILRRVKRCFKLSQQ